MDNLLSWRASSFFLDKQISTLQISASPTQRHILSKEIPYSFPWASLQTANLSIFLLYPPTASYHHYQEVLNFCEYLWRSWLTAKIQPPQNARGDECGQYICAIFSPPCQWVFLVKQTFSCKFEAFSLVFGSLLEIFTVLLAASLVLVFWRQKVRSC